LNPPVCKYNTNQRYIVKLAYIGTHLIVLFKFQSDTKLNHSPIVHMDPSVSGNSSSLSPAFEWRTVELSHKSKEVPSSRWGHSMILTHDYLFVFGGYAGNRD
jgi:hypothetical protein